MRASEHFAKGSSHLQMSCISWKPTGMVDPKTRFDFVLEAKEAYAMFAFMIL